MRIRRGSSKRLSHLLAAALAAAPALLSCDRAAKPTQAAASAVPPKVNEQVLALSKDLSDANPAKRRAAFQQLAKLGPQARAAIPALLQSLTSTDVKARRSAEQVLGRIGEPAVVPLHDLLIVSEDFALSRGVAAALGEIGPPARVATPQLKAAALEDDSALRAAALLALGRVNAEAGRPTAIKSFELKDGTIADIASIVLGEEGKNDGGKLSGVQRVNSEPGQTRQTLTNIGIPAHMIDGPLPDEGEQKTVLTLALGGSTKEVADVLPILVQALGSWDETTEVRAAAAEGLGHIGPAASPAVRALRSALDDEDEVAINAVWALGEIGPHAAEAVPSLVDAAQRHRDEKFRRACAMALAKIQPR